MYVYLYDNFLKNKRYDSLIKAMETRLTDYGIAGKIIRLQRYTNCEMLIEDEIRKGAKTIVVVGNDVTFGHVLSRAASCRVIYGFLPVGSENSIAEVLGLPVGIDACDVLAKRRKLYLYVGWLNNRYFISQLQLSTHSQNPHSSEGAGISASKILILFVSGSSILSISAFAILKVSGMIPPPPPL